MNDRESENPDNTRPETLEAAQSRIEQLERRLAEEHELRCRAENNERCFRELAEHIREVFWMTNPLGDELVYISPAYEQIWGQTCQSLYDDPGRRLAWVHDADREEVLKAFKRDAANGDYDKTFRINRPDGEVRWIRDRAFPVLDDEGELYRLAGFALDVTDRIALTPVAIAEGHALADTLYGARPRQVSHDNVPSAVFTQPPIASVGMSEEQAAEAFGEITVYTSKFNAMKNTLSGRSEKTFMKLIVETASDRVVGAHMLGPDAGEIMQGIGVAVVAGATKADFDATIGIHPTAAEEFVTMRTPRG